jgi:2-phosphoxylose phosphatase
MCGEMFGAVVLAAVLFGKISSGYELKIPDYCSKDMSERAIPPLDPESSTGMRLKQVQVLIRHGARTPYTAHVCWKGYNIQWNNCNVSEIMEASPSRFTSPVSEDGHGDGPYWRFRKVYDAYPNQLGGNCLTGQLISEGYDQEIQNGQLLRGAYIGSGDLHLFNTSVWEELDHQRIYFRSDDEQRTLMSGQILVHALFDLKMTEIIDWHTGDYLLDTLSPNPTLCPVLNEITFFAEQERQQLFMLDEKNLEKRLEEVFGSLSTGDWSWRYLQDCLMTTLCTGKNSNLPSNLTQELLDKAINHMERSYGFKSLWNHSEFSKLAMTNTAFKLRTRLEDAIREQSLHTALKFVLYGDLPPPPPPPLLPSLLSLP